MNKEGVDGCRMDAGGAGGRHRDLKIQASSSSSSSYLYDASNCSSVRSRHVFFMDDDNDNNDQNTVMMVKQQEKKIFEKQDSKMKKQKKQKMRANSKTTSIESIFRGDRIISLSSPMKLFKRYKTTAATTTSAANNSPSPPPPPPTTSNSSLTQFRHTCKSFWIERRRLKTTKQYMHENKRARGEVWQYHFTNTIPPPTVKQHHQQEQSYLLLSPSSSPLCQHPPLPSPSSNLRQRSLPPPKIPTMIHIKKTMNGSIIEPTMNISNDSTTHVTMKKPSYNGSTTTTNEVTNGRNVSGTDMIPTMKPKLCMNITIDTTDIGHLYEDTDMIVLSLSNNEWPSTATSSSVVRKPYHYYRPQHYKRRPITTSTMNGNSNNKMKMNHNKESSIRGIVYQRMPTLPSFDDDDSTTIKKEMMMRHPNNTSTSSSLLHTGYVLQILGLTDDDYNINDDDDSCIELLKRQYESKCNKIKKSEPVLI